MTYDFRTRLWAIGEKLIVTVLGKTLGIGVVVRYLRNPNPRTTVGLLRAFGGDGGRSHHGEAGPPPRQRTRTS